MKKNILLTTIIFLSNLVLGITGTVILSNGNQYSGNVLLSRNVSFWDRVSERNISLSLSQISQIHVLESGIELKKDLVSIDKSHYITGVMTRSGNFHWGYFSARVTIYGNKKKHRYWITKHKNNDRASVSKIIFSDSDNPNFPSLSGTLKPADKFNKVYAVNIKEPIIFSGNINVKKQSYKIFPMMPGFYDLFFIGDDYIVFNITPSQRENVLDTPIRPKIDGFQKFVIKEIFSDQKSKKTLIYSTGRYSNARALVLEELPTASGTLVLVWFYQCYYKHGRWRIKNFFLLHKGKNNHTIPTFLTSDHLANIFYPNNGGARSYHCIWE